MELWIRSQDKEDLIEVHSVEVEIKDKIKIITLINANTIVELGTYESKERALEVLGEIQKLLLNNFNISKNYEEADLFIKANILANMVKLYEMPQR